MEIRRAGYEQDTADSLLGYVKSGEDFNLERLQEVREAIGEMLLIDDEHSIVGLADASCLEYNHYGHLNFIVDSDSKSILELEEEPFGDGEIADVIDSDIRIQRLIRQNRGKSVTAEQAVAMRAAIMLVATEALIARAEGNGSEDENCA